MKKISTILSVAAVLACASSCKESMEQMTDRVFAVAEQQLTLMDARLGETEMPKTIDANGEVVNSPLRWWCSGFFPGSLWYTYEYTGSEAIKALAEKNTHKLDNIVEMKTSHDIGFQTNCSFGNAYRLTGDSTYLPVMEAAAAKLAKRFSPTVGCIRSWDFSAKGHEWGHPVIIDNMMNLEHLMNCSKLFSCDSLAQIAISHASTTMANHFRDDYTCFHVVDYNPENGEVHERCTHQGLSDDSAWARGQAWAIYGYTMMYKETGKEEFLEHAIKVADMILTHLPKDGIPYWDFDAPDIPNALRDASAGAIMAGAYIDLAGFVNDATKAKSYLKIAEKQLRTLATPEYLAEPGTNGNFLLKHSVGSLPAGSEVDVPLTYADYYYLEALLRWKNR